MLGTDYAITVKMAEDYWQTVGKDGKTARKDPAKKRKKAQGFQPSVLEPAGMCLKTCNRSILRNTPFFRIFTFLKNIFTQVQPSNTC